MPIRRMKHSSASAAPVVTAIRGMCPSLESRGRRVRFASVIAVSVQAATFGTVTWRRHLPIWITSGTFTPAGMPASLNLPCTSDVVTAAGAPERARSDRT